MNHRTHFSSHAYERVTERLTMDSDEVADLLDWDLYIKVGEEKNTRRVHRLFYSHDDVQCFIAIHDEKTREVVTILPVDYYETINWHIPRQFLEEARQLVSDTSTTASSPAAAAVPVPAGFKITASLSPINGHLRHARTANLGSWPSHPYSGSAELLLQDAAFLAELKGRMLAKLRPSEYVATITVRVGKSGEPTTVDAFEFDLDVSTPG